MLRRGETQRARRSRPAWRAAAGLAVAPPSRLSNLRDRLARTLEEREPWEFEPLDAVRARVAWRAARPISQRPPGPALGIGELLARHEVARASLGALALVLVIAGVGPTGIAASAVLTPATPAPALSAPAGLSPGPDERGPTLPELPAGADVETGLTPMAAIPASALRSGSVDAEPDPFGPTVAVSSDSRVLHHYQTVKRESVAAIAERFNVSVATVRQANGLSPMTTEVPKGRGLLVPKVDGVLVKADSNDTLSTIAKATGVSAERIYRYNGLESRKISPGQVLVVPGGTDPRRPDLVPHPDGQVRPINVSSRYSGRMQNPVPSGHLTQGYHYGHWAIDIGAAYGDRVEAAARGTVIFSGWRNNGGGFQVWIAHGSDIFTTYNHMSAVTVAIGEEVRQGDQVGRIGATGLATGPHCHFEVWIGMPSQGGRRVNPFGFL